MRQQFHSPHAQPAKMVMTKVKMQQFLLQQILLQQIPNATFCANVIIINSVAIVMENEPAGTFAVWYFVEDLDLDQNGMTTVSIQPENLFELRQEDGLIVTRATFDREIRDTYELTVTACDKGTPKR